MSLLHIHGKATFVTYNAIGKWYKVKKETVLWWRIAYDIYCTSVSYFKFL